MIKKILWIFLLLILVMVTVACGDVEDARKHQVLIEETGNAVSSQEKNTTDEEVSTPLESTQGPENGISDYEILNSNKTKFEDLSFIDDDTFKALCEISGSIDCYGTFDNEDFKDNELVKEKYYKMVVGDVPYIYESKYKYLSEEFDSVKPSINPKECIYYYFDMDRDGIPELIVSDNIRYEYIFKYSETSNEITLIHFMRTGSQLLGGNKISYWQGGVGLTHQYYELDSQAQLKSAIRFYSTTYFNNRTQLEEEIYLIGFPENSENIETMKALLLNGKVDVYFDAFTATLYFKVTQDQYNEITNDYFQSRKEAEENIKEVTYTFDRLFGELR